MTWITVIRSDSQLSLTNTIYMRESAKMSILNINLNSSETFALKTAAVATAWLKNQRWINIKTAVYILAK